MAFSALHEQGTCLIHHIRHETRMHAKSLHAVHRDHMTDHRQQEKSADSLCRKLTRSFALSDAYALILDENFTIDPGLNVEVRRASL
jgi:hypothetical protein